MEHWIVVGAGSAGCVVANRASGDGTRHVTLIEAGPDLSASSMPDALVAPNFLAALAEPDRTYPHLLASRVTDGPATLYQRGRGLGGSSAVNALVALAGSTDIYRRWGWHDTAESTARVLVPTETLRDDQLGPVDRALLAADERARPAKLTIDNGRRVTAAEAYLWPVADRPNLDIVVDTEVAAITFNARTATGVRLVDGTTLASDRVVVCAGAIHTPTLLLRSGVDTAGVGDGLQDHPSVVLTLALRPTTVGGPIPIGSHLHHAIGEDVVQLLPMNTVSIDTAAPRYGALLAAVMTPRGRTGTVRVDDRGQPQVDFALLDDPHDLQTLCAAAELAINTVRHPAFTDIVEQVFIDDAGTSVEAITAPDDRRDWVSEHCGDYVHATSTCAMGTVVDRAGSLLGYDGISVCDASIFPTIPDANTHLPTMMAAERLCRPGRLLG